MTLEYLAPRVYMEEAASPGRGYPAKRLTRKERIAAGDLAAPRKLSFTESTALFKAEQIAKRVIPELAR